MILAVIVLGVLYLLWSIWDMRERMKRRLDMLVKRNGLIGELQYLAAKMEEKTNGCHR